MRSALPDHELIELNFRAPARVRFGWEADISPPIRKLRHHKIELGFRHIQLKAMAREGKRFRRMKLWHP